jgi:AsmA family protein
LDTGCAGLRVGDCLFDFQLVEEDKSVTQTEKWLIGMASFFLLLIAAVSFFDWNLARSYVARKVTESTGRSFAINGDLDVHLSLRPRIIANDIVMGNAPWSKDPTMAQIKRVDFRIDILQLVRGRWVFPDITLSEPRIVVELDKDGTPNWVFDHADNRVDQQREFPTINALAIDTGTLIYRNPTLNTDIAFKGSTVQGTVGNPDSTLELAGKGTFKGMQTVLHAQGGALLALRSADKPYPVKATATIGTTRASVDGTLNDPLNFNGEELNFQLEGSDLALLFPIFGVPIPPTPAYKLAGFLSHTGNVWTFKRFNGVVGNSDLAGDFSVDRSRTPQLITANLTSRSLDMKDLGGFIGANRGTKPSDQPPPGDKMLPTEPFSLEKLRAADADVLFKGAKIITEKMPLENMTTHLIVKDGILRLAPLNFGVAGGNLVTQVEMDGRQSQIVTHADITATGLQLERLFPDAKLNAASSGTLGGRAKLKGTGTSMATMLGTADGDAALIIDGGTVSELLLRMSNLDIANSLVLLFGGDKEVPIRCMVANFKATKGVFAVQDLVLDTPKVNITGQGSVNLADESLDLRLVSKSKGFSLVSLRGPVVVTGTFKNPTARPELGNVVARAGLAVALGALTAGAGTLIPLLDFGKDKDSNCTALMDQAKSDAGIKESDIAPRRQNPR